MRMRKYFTTYRNVVPSDYEKWLEDLAAEGWHPTKIRHFSSIVMKFEKSEPRQYKYSVELLGKLSKDRIKTYEDFGWEYVGRMSSIFVWRKQYSDKKPEMFTESTDIRKRSSRFVIAISFTFALFLIAFIATLVIAALMLIGKIQSDWLQVSLGILLSGVFTLYLGYVIKKISKNKNR